MQQQNNQLQSNCGEVAMAISFIRFKKSMKRLQSFWEYIKNEKNIILSLLGFILVGLICWLSSTKTEDFGSNFFTEMLGVAVTVFIVDRLIQKRDEKRNIPQKLAAYEDVRLYASRYINFWTETYRLSVPEPDPETIEDFFSEKGMSKILDYLNMDSEPNVTPTQKWWSWIVDNAKEFKENGDKILDRHSHNLDPIAFGFVHQLTESSFNNVLMMMPSIRQSDISMKFPRIKILRSYSIFPTKEDFEAVLGLVNWCNESYSMLQKYNNSIRKVMEYKPNKDGKAPPKCMIQSEVLKQQIDDLQKYRDKTS